MDKESFGDIPETLEVSISYTELSITDAYFEEIAIRYRAETDGGPNHLEVWYPYNFIEKKNYASIKFCH